MTAGSATRLYLDTNVIIRFIESEDEGLLFLFEQAAIGRVELLTSEFTLAEVLVMPYRTNDTELRSVYEDFLASDEFLTVVPVTRPVLKESAAVRAALGAKGPDAIHVATAVLSGCKVFVSSDQRVPVPGGMMRLDIELIPDIDRWL